MYITKVLRVASVPALVSSAWLAGQLSAKTPRIRVLDTTWDASGKVGHQDYLRKHIENASFFDLNRIMKSTPPTILWGVPSEQEFNDYVASLGVNSDSHVVLYDTHFMFDIPYGSAKVWWLFRLFGHERVSVLHGGMRKWLKEERPATTDIYTPEMGDFTPKLNKNLIFTYHQMVDNVKSKERDIVDCRLADDYQGKQPEPCELMEQCMELKGIDPKSVNLHRGHMREAFNVPFVCVGNEETHGLKGKEDLLKILKESRVDLSRPLVTTCYVGMTACTMALAAAVCGKTDVPVYEGSWIEFSQRADKNLCTYESDS